MTDQIVQDVRYAFRSLGRRPLVTGVAVVSLALGIGVNTAIFSVFERLLLRQVAVPAPDGLVNLTSAGPKPGGRQTGNGGGSDHVFSYPLFRDLEGVEVAGLSPLAAQRNFGANLAWSGGTARVEGLLVSGSYFQTLGVSPAFGRLLTPEDDRVTGGHPIVVLSHRYWANQYAADPSIVGMRLVVNGEPMTIVGVTAEAFVGTVALDTPQVFVPLAMAERLRAGSVDRRDHYLYLFARLESGVTREQAEAAVNGPFSALIRDVEYPVHAGELPGRLREQFLSRRIALEDGRRLRVADRGEASLIIGLMLAVTGLVLLIACANVANLLLARAADRTHEMAVRVSMGASTGRLVRLLLAEATILGALGAGGALVVAESVSLMLLRIMPPDDAGRFGFDLNAPILMYALALGVGTGVLFGLVPALHTLRSSRALAATAQPGRVSPSRATTRFRASLATAQIALATALLATAGLFITSLVNLARDEIGIEKDGLITFRLAPYLNGYSAERALTLFERVEDELGQTSGVASIAATTVPLLAENSQRPNVLVEGFEAAPETDRRASFASVGPGYFKTMGIPLIAGREFSRADGPRTPKVAIVNEAFARKFNLGTQAIGRRVGLARAGATVPDVEIVGVVRDAKYSQMREPPPPQLFFAYRQGAGGPMTFYARSVSGAVSLRTLVPSVVARIDPTVPVDRLRTVDEQIWDNVTRDRVLATLSSWFAGLATLLAGVGLYAVLAFTVAQRFKEIGIRMAFGAGTRDVTRLVLMHVGKMAAVGGGVGLGIALGLGRFVEALLFGVSGADPVILMGTSAAVAAVVLAASLVPTRRATRVDPVIALRAE